MSFADIETGRARPTIPASSGSNSADTAFQTLQQQLSFQVFKINANVQGILKLVDQLGTNRDIAGLRKSLHDLTDTTRNLAKTGSDDLKKLTSLQAQLKEKPSTKTSLEKISHDFQLAVVAFQRAQQLSAERQRTVVQTTKDAVDEAHGSSSPGYGGHRGGGGVGSPSGQQLLQQQQQAPQLAPQELIHQEQLIQEREAEIREIESGIHELHEIFQDINTLVLQQGEQLDNIEANVGNVAADTAGAAEELTTAADYQRKAGKRAACLMIILGVVVCVVLVAILS